MTRVTRVLLVAFVCLIGYGLPGRIAGPVAEASAVAGERSSVPSTQPQRVENPSHSAAWGDVPAIDLAAAADSGVSMNALRVALQAVGCAIASGAIDEPATLTVIDYSLPSTEPRLWVFDLATGEMLFEELVAHGRNTGANMAVEFSDSLNSHQSSLGLFVTGDTYVGSNGYSLRLDGLEPGFNGRARERAIVMHGAWYVDRALAASQGRIGRSWGCPALRDEVARDVIDTIRGGGVMFAYYPEPEWLERSRFLNGCGSAAATRVAAAS